MKLILILNQAILYTIRSLGCGKTTILKLIAGFEYPDSGDIIYKDKPIGKMPPSSVVNTVFQDYALFPHLNVFDNIAYGLKLKIK